MKKLILFKNPEAADGASQSIIIFFFDWTDLKMTDEKEHILYSFDAHIEFTLQNVI